MKPKKLSILMMLAIMASVFTFNSCKKDKDDEPAAPVTSGGGGSTAACAPDTMFTSTGTSPKLVFKFVFDSTQVRLDNVGNPSTVPAGHAAQSPVFNWMSQHYIELAGDLDSLGHGQVLYLGTQTTAGGASAIDYCSSIQTRQNVTFFSKPLSTIAPGSYKWLRVSLAYQNYNIKYKSTSVPGGFGTGTIASFIGFRTYVTGYQINGVSYTPSSGAGGPGNHNQGYWGFQTTVAGTNYFVDGQSAGTTVPNPLFATSPIPAGSCVVTGQFVDNTMANSPLVITGLETSDIVITVSLSTNKSFEWIDSTPDGYFEPSIGEAVVDMGIRGLIPIKN
ncbi:MAG: hypothetical protein ACJ77K_08845 [Bacteroidia bacterium]